MTQPTQQDQHPMVRPLRKIHGESGEIMFRRPEVKEEIEHLLRCEVEEVERRLNICNHQDPEFLKDESVLHLFRNSDLLPESLSEEFVFKILSRRTLSLLHQPGDDGDECREIAFGKFSELLGGEKGVKGYEERLDYFEVNFNHALKSLRSTTCRPIWRRRKRTVELSQGLEDESSRILDVESIDEFFQTELDKFSNYDSRILLNAAIEDLPEDLRLIITMTKEGFPVESATPNTVSIAGTLGKSPKTVRKYQSLAMETLKTKLETEIG